MREWYLAEWDADPATRLATTRIYNEHLTETIVMVDEWLLRASDVSPPPFLEIAVEQECASLGLENRLAVLSYEAPDNYTTFVADFEAILFDGLDGDHETPPDEERRLLALIHIPRLEGANAMCLPTLVGHEVAHLYVEEHQSAEAIDWELGFDFDKAGGLAPPNWIEGTAAPPVIAYALERAAIAWVEELLCDAYAVRRFGPAALAAIASYLEMNGALAPSRTHPAAWTRIELMRTWLDALEPDGQKVLADLRQPWEEHGPPDGYQEADWAAFLTETVSALGEQIAGIVAEWPGEAFEFWTREPLIETVAQRLEAGLPSVAGVIGGAQTALTDADVANAGWLAASEDEPSPVSRLVRQSFETIQFRQVWDTASEAVGAPAQAPPPEANPAPGPASGILSRSAIEERLAQHGPHTLELVPLMPDVLDDSAIDLRLGNKFVVFHSSVVDSFDPLDDQRDPRMMQTYIERAWGDTFVLHPNELVLATALEYLALPGDLAGQVHTRSSYGRLGLLTATALHVHPWYSGVLTLELVNLSEVPLKLTPGERVAQLVLYNVSPAAPQPPVDEKYRCSTSPEFSKVRKDRDSTVLRQIRADLEARLGTVDG